MKILKQVLILVFFLAFSLTNYSQSSKRDSLILLIKKVGVDTTAVEALIALGEITYESPEKQFLYYNQALNISLKLDYIKGEADSYSSFGIYYTQLSNFEKAIDYLNKATLLYKELGLKDMEAAALGNSGNVYCYQGDFEKGLKCFLDALDVMYELDDKNWIATAKNNIGSVYTYLYEDSLALQYYEEAYDLFKQINDDNGMSLALGNIANVKKQLGNTEEALHYYLAAVELDKKTGNLQQLAVNYTNLATAYGDLKDNLNAIQYFQDAISVFEQTGNKNGLSVTYLTFAYFYRDINQSLKAKKYLELSKQISEEIGAKYTLMTVYRELAYHDSLDGNYLSALMNYQLHADIKHDIYQSEKTEQISEMQVKFDTERKEKENELLKEKNKKNELINQRKNIVIIAAAALFLLMTIIGIIILRISNLRKKTNRELEEKNIEINQQREEIQTQNDILHKQNLQIEKSHKKITDSINYAGRIQEAMLPSKLVFDQFLPENFIFFQPRDIVSGDFYWIQEVREYLIIAVADCTGHGVPGALLSMLGMSLLNDIVKDPEITKPSQVLEEMRFRIKKSLKQTGSQDEQKDGIDMGLCAINLKTEHMLFAGANISLWHYRNNELLIHKSVQNPIGISHRELPFEDVGISLLNDDIFYLFSDGIVDQFHFKTNQKLKTSGLKSHIEKHIHKPFYEQHQETIKLYKSRTGNMKNQTDDILFLGFKIN
jgi:serine phosphatase RsbU (regulator of sigma subunit)